MNPNAMKLLQALGGMASENYSQGGTGGQQRMGGQPILPKPAISRPDMLSPYAPGNQQGGMHAGSGLRGTHGSDNPAPNKTQGVIATEMGGDTSNHPAAQLAEYLHTAQGRSARTSMTGTNPAAFIRGGYAG